MKNVKQLTADVWYKAEEANKFVIRHMSLNGDDVKGIFEDMSERELEGDTRNLKLMEGHTQVCAS